MRRVVTAAALTLIIALPPLASAQVQAGAMITSDAATVLTLVSVDPISHIAVLSGHDGMSLALELPAEAQKMRYAKPGALFRMHAVESLGLEMERGGTAGKFEDQSVALTPSGAAPAIEVVTVKRFAFKVQGVDKTRQRITLRDAQDNVSTLTYSGLLHSIGDVAVGDTFSLLHIEVLTLEMMPAHVQTSR
jgi:hypothetical protein